MSTLEWVRNLDLFKHDGLLSWRILSLRPGWIFHGDGVRSLFWARSTTGVLAIRMVAAVTLLASNDPCLLCIALVVIVATSWFLTIRTWLGEDGSDQMGQIVAIGSLLISAGIFFDQLALSFAGTLLIAGQLTISYFFAGFAKLRSPEWRRGQALVGVMGTHSYGHSFGARISSGSAAFGTAFCWLVILGESMFPLVIFAPQTALLIVLAAFLLFHLANALFMGLNTFVWPFLAAYPSVIVLNNLITHSIGLR
ncbi:hypothetical protein [Paraburkholderia kirstenboschensis]|uniref:hypothetical protein n=1 Tax=Paraburkholderia kirstenboschensis TaxID=1245436 RepID=UPI000FFC8A03|nr:hypothetical protein [Paraburkholderia kirstenboschensis]